MKKLVPLLALLPAVLSAAPSYVGVGTFAAANNGTVTPSINASSSLDDLNVICGFVSNAAGTPNTPAGYTLFDQITGGRAYQKGKFESGSDPDPAISLTGGAGGNINVAQVASFRGLRQPASGVVHAFAHNAITGTSITVPSMTITENGTLVVLCVTKRDSWASLGDYTDSTAGAFIKVSDPSSTLGTDAGIGIYYQVQTTATNLGGGTITIDDSAQGSSGYNVVAVSYLPALNSPTLSGIAIGTRTTTTIPYVFTMNQTGTVYAIAQATGGAAPSCTQIKAGQNGAGGSALYAWSEAVTANVADGHTFTVSSSPYDIYFCGNHTTNGDSIVYSSLGASKLPAFSVGPTVSSCGTGGCTLSFTLDGPGTVYGVACKAGSTPATVGQTEAAQCTGAVSADASANKAVTGADTLVVGTSLPLPVYDFSIVGVYNSQHEAATHPFTDRLLTAPAGFTYTKLTSIGTTSQCQKTNDRGGNIATGDILETPTTTTPASFLYTQLADCDSEYGEPIKPADASRQYICTAVYDYSEKGWMTGGGVPCAAGLIPWYWNNNIPVGPDRGYTLFVPVGSPMVPVNFANLCSDADNDSIVATLKPGSPALPSGLALTNSVLQGTALVTQITTGLGIRCTDQTGEYVDWE